MAVPSDSYSSNVQAKAFPFMSLHAELRQMVYQEVFSCRGIVLRETRDRPGTYGCGRRYWHFRLHDSRDTTNDGAIALLQTSRRILTEAKPLLLKYTPSHLTLSKNLRRQPAYLYQDELIEAGLPFQYIAYLNLNVKCLGSNPKYQRECPGPRETFSFISRHYRLTNCSMLDDEFDVPPPPDPKRDPNLKGLHNVSQFFASLPALREIHIYDVLKHHLSHPLDPCTCPKMGTTTCTCGECQCDCTVYPPLPNSPGLLIAETRDVLHTALLYRFRAALPAYEAPPWRRFSDYHAILDSLTRGAHVFLHEELVVTIPTKDGKSIHKGLWRAKYHLSTLDNAVTPAEIPKKAAETPRQQRLRKERGAEAQEYGPMSSHLDPFRLDFDDFNDEGFGCVTSQELRAQALVAFEAGFDLELVNGSEFDEGLKDASLNHHRLAMEEKYGKFWQWD